MKKVPCSYSKCGERRVHWCDPFTSRGQQMVEVPDNRDPTQKQYCSLTCQMLDKHVEQDNRIEE